MRSGSHDQHANSLQSRSQTQHLLPLGQQAHHNIPHGSKCFLESAARLSHQIFNCVTTSSTLTTEVATRMLSDRWNLLIVHGHENFPSSVCIPAARTGNTCPPGHLFQGCFWTQLPNRTGKIPKGVLTAKRCPRLLTLPGCVSGCLPLSVLRPLPLFFLLLHRDVKLIVDARVLLVENDLDGKPGRGGMDGSRGSQ